MVYGKEDVDTSDWFTVANTSSAKVTRQSSDPLNLVKPRAGLAFQNNFIVCDV